MGHSTPVIAARDIEQSQTNLGALFNRKIEARQRPRETCDVRESQLDVEESLVKEFSFKQIASNPSGESLGTAASLDIASGVTSSLEGTIEEMVESIVGEDESFNVEKWKEAWDKAVAEE